MKTLLLSAALASMLIGLSAQNAFAYFEGVSDEQIMKDWKDAKFTCAHGNPEMSATTQSCALINDAVQELYNRGYRWHNGRWTKRYR
jgi:hypothetical protein